MPIEYMNNKRDLYYLHEGVTKKGNPKYFFSKKSDGKILDFIPDGYEIYEKPNGEVFLTRIQPRIILDREVEIVKKYIPEEVYSKIDVRKNIITIYLSDSDLNRFYLPMMRFILVDKVDREFEAERYCFRSAIDDWLYLDSSYDLEYLAGKCCSHLGKNSFYDLPYLVYGFYDK